ncbi:unnamed protein product [Effrenium voratum]|nr:unnamed protein product [Effrenium voratum]
MSTPVRFVIGETSAGSTRAFLLPVGLDIDTADVTEWMITEKEKLSAILRKEYTVKMLTTLGASVNVRIKSRDVKQEICNKIADRLVEGLEDASPRGFSSEAFVEDIAKAIAKEAVVGDGEQAKETIRGLVELSMSKSKPDTWSDADAKALEMLLNANLRLGNFADDLIGKLQEKKATLDEKKMAENDVTQRLQEALSSLNEKIMKQETLYMNEYNKAFHGMEFEAVADRLMMLQQLRRNIKSQLGMDESNGKATLEKVVNEDVELNEKTSATRGTAIVYASKKGCTVKWSYHYTSHCKILDIQHAITKKIGIEMGSDSPFRLTYSNGKSVFELWEPCEATLVHDKTIILTVALQGGAKGGGKVKKQVEKKKFAEKLKSDMPSDVLQNAQYMSSFQAFKSLQQMLNTVMANADANPQNILENLMQNCSVADLDKTIDALSMGENSVQGRLKKGSLTIFGENMSKVIAMKEETDALIDSATAVFQYVFTQASISDPSFNLGKMKQLLIHTKAFKEGAQSVQDTDL